MPHTVPLLQEVLLLLLASVPIAFLFNKLRFPTIVGFMITGVLIGPYGLGLIRDVEAIDVLAEIGVVLLLFTIGLEFSLRHFLEMKRLFLLGGGLQVVLTTMFVTVIAYLLNRPLNQAVFFGFLFALSSTAIVLKTYADRAEIDAPHGRAGVGILLFQDLSIVPMMLLVPILGGNQGVSATRIALTLGAAVGVIALIVFTARTVVPYLLYHIVRLRSPEIFIISVVLLSLGTSWLTAQFGLSLALGAFIAGIMISESEYSHQIIAEVLPFRYIFNSLFFISIGMLLSISALASDLAIVLAWVAALVLGKMLLVLAIVRLLGYSARVATMTGLGLAQIGEFSFILAKAGLPQDLLSVTDYQRFLAASIISMIATPFLIKAAPRIGYAIQSLFPARTTGVAALETLNSEASEEMRGHVIIIGYGLNGRNLARVLRKTGVPYVVMELNAEVVRKAREEGERIVYGDAMRRELLHHVGLEHARILVVAISDPTATRHTVWLSRQLNSHIHIIVRTRYMSEMKDLRKLGADEIIPEEFETSIEIFSRVLREYGMAHVIRRHIAEIRSEGYQMLRDPSASTVDMTDVAEALKCASSDTLFVEPGSFAAGKSIGELRLRTETGATIIAVTRSGETQINPGPEYVIEAEDMLVLLGGPEQIDQAAERVIGMKELV